MKIRQYCIIFIVAICTNGAYAQLGIKAGINMANEIKSFSSDEVTAGYKSENLTGYHIGLLYQIMPAKSGFGLEIGALLSQKGSVFSFDSTTVGNSIREGYTEMNYLEVPLNLRYRLSLGGIGIYGYGGIYGGYVLNSKTVDEISDISVNKNYSRYKDRLDYGYNFGAGLEFFKKIQLGASWCQGLKNTGHTEASENLTAPLKSTNRVYSINLVYLF